jgi:hypothetical protein
LRAATRARAQYDSACARNTIERAAQARG